MYTATIHRHHHHHEYMPNADRALLSLRVLAKPDGYELDSRLSVQSADRQFIHSFIIYYANRQPHTNIQ